MIRKRIASTLMLALLASCGGGGGSASGVVPPTGSNTPASTGKSVKIALIIPNGHVSSARPRRPKFVSPSALGASVAVTGSHGGSGSATVDLSSGSSACGTVASQRSCTATVTVPIDTDTFTVTLYDTAPVSGAIPTGAHVLGVGTVVQAITPTFSGSLPIVVGGSVATIGASTAYTSVPADGSIHVVGITIAPTDFGNNPLTGASPVPYANPITATLTETGGATMTLMLDGATSTGPAMLKSSSDSVSISYSGAGSPGDTATLTLSATGAPAETVTISPLFVTSPSTFFGSGTLSLNGAATQIPLTTSEASAPTSIVVNASGTGCTNIATIQTQAVPVGPTPPPGTATFLVTGGATASAGACSITVNDTITNYTFAVVNTPVGGTLPLPGESIQSYTIVISPTPPGGPLPPASPQAVTGGPDGRLWISDVLNGGVAAMTTSGVATQYVNSAVRIGNAGLAVGSDGNLYGADANQVTIDTINPSNGTYVRYTHTTYGPVAAALGVDGRMWVTESSGSAGLVAALSPSGVLTEYPVTTVVSSPSPQGITAGPSGTMWLCVNSPLTGAGEIDSISVATGAMTTLATLPVDCANIAMQSDGKAAWVTTNANSLYRVDASTFAVTAVTISGTSVAVAAGADNAVYVTETGGSYVARISDSAPAPYTPNELAVSSGSPTGIALGSDGRMWFGENGQNEMGALSP